MISENLIFITVAAIVAAFWGGVAFGYTEGQSMGYAEGRLDESMDRLEEKITAVATKESR